MPYESIGATVTTPEFTPSTISGKYVLAPLAAPFGRIKKFHAVVGPLVDPRRWAGFCSDSSSADRGAGMDRCDRRRSRRSAGRPDGAGSLGALFARKAESPAGSPHGCERVSVVPPSYSVEAVCREPGTGDSQNSSFRA